MIIQIKATYTYKEFTAEALHVSQHWRYILNKSVEVLIHLDIDAMRWWLRSYTKARLQQVMKTEQIIREAKFFLPVRPPSATALPLNNWSLDNGVRMSDEEESHI
jgi:hypothetical protein